LQNDKTIAKITMVFEDHKRRATLAPAGGLGAANLIFIVKYIFIEFTSIIVFLLF
jgi:hypothetical protein